MPERAQVSLELLALAAAAFAILSLVLAGFSHARSSAFAAIDRQQAQAFSQSAQDAAGTLALLGDGSSLHLRAQSLGDWTFHSSAGACAISLGGISSDGTSAVAGFPADSQIPMPENVLCDFSGTVKGKLSFTMRKISGALVLTRNDG